MSLKQLVNQKILGEISGVCGQKSWKVLILDQLTTRIISSCCELGEVINNGIVLIEDITKIREPLPTLDAIYFISPESSKLLEKDFEDGNRLYDMIHVFFTSTCPDNLFEDLRQSQCSRFIRTLKEINISFVPYETQVFSLDCSTDMFAELFASSKKILEECADRLATLCVTLGEYPRIGFRTDSEGLNVRFATLVQQKIDFYKTIEPQMKEGYCQLLIVDRGFDCITPLIHDLCFQAMIYDLLEELIFNDKNRLWSEFRHKHIAVVNTDLPIRVRQFNADNKIMETRPDEQVDMKKLSQIVKNLPIYQKEKGEYSAFIRLTEDCMNRYKTFVNKVCLVEQDIAMGSDVQGTNLANSIKGKKVFPLFIDPHIQPYDKIRIILLYILSNDGITDENLQRLMQHANISDSDQAIINNLKLLGIDMDPARRIESYPRKDRINEETYDTARWTPTLKDIMEDAAQNKLSTKHFKYLSDDKPLVTKAAPKSLRFGGNEQAGLNQAKKSSLKLSTNRLIIFVLGGVTYSEMRCAYEVSKTSPYQVIVGSDQIITPTSFLENLRQLGTR
ncbi:Syntaxin-binding protein 1 [Blomia tropicalis]|nr:Syntaxin-binding protein 1 [Blomia tropicalis]